LEIGDTAGWKPVGNLRYVKASGLVNSPATARSSISVLACFLMVNLLYTGRLMGDVTKLLGKAAGGDANSLNQLYEQVYVELRAIAVQKMASERPDHTLQPTALVHEAYLRLGGAERFKFENRAHFFASAAEAMRRILVDSARRHRQHKRGGDQERVELHETRIAAPVEDEKLLLVNEALDTLAREDPINAEVAKMRYFVGLTHREIADALGVSEITVHRHWATARVRLFELIKNNGSASAVNPPPEQA
jgi:RNA polymerase sigma factor (TIGR02999 family)